MPLKQQRQQRAARHLAAAPAAIRRHRLHRIVHPGPLHHPLHYIRPAAHGGFFLDEGDAGRLGGIYGGWHLSRVCMHVFLVLGTARGAAGRAFPAMLRARARKSRRCQFSVFFTGAADARKGSVGRSPFFQPRGSLFLCGSSSNLITVPVFFTARDQNL